MHPIGYVSGQMTVYQAFGNYTKWQFVGVSAGLLAGLAVFTFPAWGPRIAQSWLLQMGLVTGLASISVAAWRAGGVGSLLSGLNIIIPPYPIAAASKYVAEIKAAGNRHGIPPELLATVLTAERYDYNAGDWLLDDIMIKPEEHSIGLPQLRIDNMRKWGIRGWNNSTPAWEIRSALMNHEESIDVLAEVLAHFLSSAPVGRRQALQNDLSNWNTLTYTEKEVIAVDFAGAKDTGTLMKIGMLANSADDALRDVVNLGVY